MYTHRVCSLALRRVAMRAARIASCRPISEEERGTAHLLTTHTCEPFTWDRSEWLRPRSVCASMALPDALLLFGGEARVCVCMQPLCLSCACYLHLYT